MEKVDKILISLFFILLILTIYTIFNTQKVEKAVNSCSSGLEIVSKCQCIPDKGIAKLLGRNIEQFELNIGNLTNEDKNS